MNTDLPHTEELADNSEESDFDPEEPAPANMSAETGDPLPELTDSESDEEQMVPYRNSSPTGAYTSST